MEINTKNNILDKITSYFPETEIPLAIWYSDDLNDVELASTPKKSDKGYTCIFQQLGKVRKGTPLAFNASNIGCIAAASILGFIKPELDQNTIDFLTKIECFKKSEKEVREMYDNNPYTISKGKYLIIKPFDALTETDTPEIISFFASPNTMSALHALASYDKGTSDNVISPFGSGCDTLIGFALKEIDNKTNRPIIGGLDPAMRAYIKKDKLTFSIPYSRFLTMVDNMDSSFLNTYVWKEL